MVSSTLLLLAAGLAALTGLAAAAAAAGEGWRYLLMARGRTQVLDADVLAADDRLVQLASWTTLVLSLVAALTFVMVVVRLHGQAARLAGRAPSRPAPAVLARLMIPGWNLYGAGQVVAELDGTLAARYELAAGRGRPRPGRLAQLWAVAWAVSGLLVLAMLGRAFGTSLQAVADTVELHFVVDLLAVLVAGLSCALALRWRRLGNGRDRRDLRGWTVAPPQPTSRRGTPAVTTPVGPQESDTTATTEPAADQPPTENTPPSPAPVGAEASHATEAATCSAEESAEPTTQTPHR